MLRTIAEFRLKNYFVITKVFVFANVLMLLVHLIWLIGGIQYTLINMPNDDDEPVDGFMAGVKAFVGFFFVIVLCICLGGIVIGNQEKAPRVGVLLYGVCIFFFMMIPLFVEGSALRSLNSNLEPDATRE